MLVIRLVAAMMKLGCSQPLQRTVVGWFKCPTSILAFCHLKEGSYERLMQVEGEIFFAYAKLIMTPPLSWLRALKTTNGSKPLDNGSPHVSHFVKQLNFIVSHCAVRNLANNWLCFPNDHECSQGLSCGVSCSVENERVDVFNEKFVKEWSGSG